MKIFTADSFKNNRLDEHTKYLLDFETSGKKEMLVQIEEGRDYFSVEELHIEIGKWEVAILNYNRKMSTNFKLELHSNVLLIKKS